MKLLALLVTVICLCAQTSCSTGSAIETGVEPAQGSGSISFGTGCVISPDGLVLTSLHVVEGMERCDLIFADESRARAELLAADPGHDLAVLKIIDAQPRAWLGLATDDSLWMGQQVFSIGYPAVQILGARPSIGEGVIARLEGTEDVPGSIMTTVPIQPGDSGGALVDHEGRVVGVIAASADALAFVRSTGALPQNVNWAVKASWVRAMVEVPAPPPPLSTRRAAIEKAAAATCWILAIRP